VSAWPELEPEVAAVLPDLSDSDFEAALAAARAHAGVRAPPCGCEGGPIRLLDDRELGPRCLRCGRRLEERPAA
jgi:hypothetical protein